METLFTIVVIVLAAAFLLGLHIRYWRRRYHLDLDADATYFTTTEDGWPLALHRYHGGDGIPVVLCHGLGANAYNWDLGERFSLARHLRDRGFDVWSLELRGYGASGRRSRSPGTKRTFSFDDHALRDVPAAIDLVLEESAQRTLQWVGHSMGGLAIYAYLGARRDRRVRSIIALGSPGRMTRPRLIAPMMRLAPVLRLFDWIPSRWASGLIIPFYYSLPISFITHHGRNVDTVTIRQALANLTEPISTGVLRQFATWMKTGYFCSIDERFDYQAGLTKIETPACIVAGIADQLVQSEHVQFAFTQLGSPDKRFHLLGVEQGAQSDYGHGGLVIGRAAPEDIYPLVTSWLIEHQAPKPSPTPSSESPLEPKINRYDPYTRRRRERIYHREQIRK